jgi:hypothetical protein
VLPAQSTGQHPLKVEEKVMKTMSVSRIGEEVASSPSKTVETTPGGTAPKSAEADPLRAAVKGDPLGVAKGDPLGVTKAKADPLGVTKTKVDPLGVLDQPARPTALPDAPFSPAPSLMEKALGLGAQVKSEGTQKERRGCVSVSHFVAPPQRMKWTK